MLSSSSSSSMLSSQGKLKQVSADLWFKGPILWKTCKLVLPEPTNSQNEESN